MVILDRAVEDAGSSDQVSGVIGKGLLRPDLLELSAIVLLYISIVHMRHSHSSASARDYTDSQ